MKNLSILAFSALLLGGSATLTYAQEDPNGGHHSGKKIEEILHDHAERIKEGSRSGQLTHEEADRIKSKEDEVRLQMDEFRTRNHGFLTNGEEAGLEQRLGELSERLYRLKHNDQVR